MRKALLFVSIAIFSVSCIRDVDFKQIETATFSTPMSVALVYLELNQNDFLDENNNELIKVEKLFIIDLSGFFYESSNDSLVFVSQYSNTFDRSFYCQYEFRDKDNLLIPITTPKFFVPATTLQPIVDSLTYTGRDFEQFIGAKWITMKVDLENGLPINSTEKDSLTVQSVIHFNYEITP